MTELRERDTELSVIRDAMRAAIGRKPSLMLIEGPPGIGKTTLAGAVVERARMADLRVLSARGSELERDFPFGIVGQLLESTVFTATDEQRDRWFSGAAALARPLFSPDPPPARGVEEELGFRRRHGLFWLLVNLARETPTVVVVDDAQWADDPSVAFIRHLATRLESLPVMLVVVSRPHVGGLSGLITEPGAVVLRPSVLSVAAVGEWVSESLATDAEEPFAAAVHTATGGNPFLIAELVREIAAEGLRPTARTVQRLRAMSPRGVATTVLLRLAGLSPQAAKVARATAILGPADPVVTADLAGLDRVATLRAASELTRAGILDQRPRPDLVHPLIRTVLYEDMPAPDRLLEHARAAQVLHDAGERSDHVAAQLLLAARVGEPWAAAALADAAGGAAERGAPQIAARILRRMLDEVDLDGRSEVLLWLGRMEVLAAEPGALTHLREAVAWARTPAQRTRAAISLGRMLGYHGAGGEAVELIQSAAADLEVGDVELRELAERELLATATVSYGARRLLEPRLADWWTAVTRPPTSSFDRLACAAQAVEVISAGRPVAEAVKLIDQAMAREPGAGHLGRHLRLLVAYAFMLCDRYDQVDVVLRSIAEIASSRGGGEMMATVAAQRALVACRQGQLEGAAATALEAVEPVSHLEVPPAFLLTAAAALTYVAVERGEAPHPWAARATDDGDSLFARHLNHARALDHIANRRFRQGADELLAVGERECAIGGTGPSQFPWRSQAALALQQLGEEREARHLVETELGLARVCGAPRALGVALRANALLDDGDGIDQLHEAVAVLAESGAELDHARALIDLGAALRRRRSPAAARAPLQHGHALATACGATVLAERGHDELLAAGARPRRTAVRGRAALTPSELRVAELAAQPLRNREIAQALFITEKTVERHLGHVYAKLGIRSRQQLQLALRS